MEFLETINTVDDNGDAHNLRIYQHYAEGSSHDGPYKIPTLREVQTIDGNAVNVLDEDVTVFQIVGTAKRLKRVAA